MTATETSDELKEDGTTLATTRSEASPTLQAYLHLYRFFIATHAVGEVLERVSEDHLSLASMVDSSLCPLVLPLQQRRFREAVFEVAVFEPRRAELARYKDKQTRLYHVGGSGASRSHTSPGATASSSNNHSAGAGDESGYYQPPRPSHTADCAYSKWLQHLKKNQERRAPRAGRGAEVARKLRQILFSDEQEATTTAEAAEVNAPGSPHSPPRGVRGGGGTSSAASAEDAHQCMSVEAFPEHGRPDGMRASDSLLRCPLCAAQTILQTLWSSLALMQQLTLVSDAHLAAAPLPVPQTVLHVLPEEAVQQLFHAGVSLTHLALHMVAACVEDEQAGSILAKPSGDATTVPTEEDSGIYELPRSEAMYVRQCQSFMGELAALTLKLSSAALDAVPALWPALPLPPLTTTMAQVSTVVRDVCLHVRHTLVRVCWQVFFSADGASTAQETLGRLCRALHVWEGTDASKRSAGHSIVVALCAHTQAYVKRQHAVSQRLRAAVGVVGDADAGPIEDALADYQELGHVMLLLGVFTELLHGRREMEVETPSSTVEERRSRLQGLAQTMDGEVMSYLEKLRCSADGAASSRGGRLCALAWLLRGEMARAMVGLGADLSDAIPSLARGTTTDHESPLPPLQAFSQLTCREAAEACSDAREFFGLTMQPPPSRSEEAAAPRHLWRLRVPEASGAQLHLRDVVNGHQELALLPVLWVRVWLILCPSLFHGAATDLVMARARWADAESAALCQQEQEAAATEVSPEVGARPPSSAPTRRGAPPAKVRLAYASGVTASSQAPSTARSSSSVRRKSAAVPKVSKEERRRRELEAAAAAREATRERFATALGALRDGRQDIAFWWRWRHVCVRAPTTSAEVKSSKQQSCGSPFSAAWIAHNGLAPRPGALAERCAALVHGICASVLPRSAAGGAGAPTTFFGALHQRYPLTGDAEAAYNRSIGRLHHLSSPAARITDGVPLSDSGETACFPTPSIALDLPTVKGVVAAFAEEARSIFVDATKEAGGG